MASKARGVCDIVFLIDATGSMQPCIDDIKNNIKLFFRSLEDPWSADCGAPVKDWRARVIGYRDPAADGADWYVSNPFVTDVASVEAQLDDLQAYGGGDEPEGLLDALHKVSSWDETEKGAQEIDAEKWRYKHDAARCVAIFTDASFTETTTLPEAPGLHLPDIAGMVTAARLRISLFAPQMDCYDDLAAVDRLEYHGFAFDPDVRGDAVQKLRDLTSDIPQFQKTIRQLSRTFSAFSYEDVL